MSAPGIIVALYPPAVRERWGAEIGREVAERGPRTWADAVAGAVRLWVHPRDWPETAAGQTRRVLAVALFAVTAAATLLLRASSPHTTAFGLAPLGAGALLAAPLPPLTWHAARSLAAVAARTMALPAALGGAMVALANSGLVENPRGPLDAVLVVYYWSTLTYFALRGCTLVARALPACTAPTTRRLRGALLLTGAGLAFSAGEGAYTTFRTPGDVVGLCVTVGLALLAALTLQAGQNLDRPRRT